MFDIIFNTIAFIIALGVLITFHEFGHYWVARKAGVKVLRFSVGFGTPLWKRTAGADNTEYVLAAIPLGGYVKMLDEREGEVAEGERHRAFNNKSVLSRCAIVVAGPLANFLLAIVTYWLMFVIGISGIVPIVGEIEPHSIAARAGFAEQDRIVSMDGKTVTTWESVRFTLLDSSLGGDGTRVALDVVDEQGLAQTRYINEDFSHLLEQRGDLVKNIGLSYWWPPVVPVIASVQAGSPADAAGLQAGDRFVELNKQAIPGWSDLVRLVRAQPGQQVDVVIERNGQLETLALTIGERDINGVKTGFIGALVDQSSDAREKCAPQHVMV